MNSCHLTACEANCNWLVDCTWSFHVLKASFFQYMLLWGKIKFTVALHWHWTTNKQEVSPDECPWLDLGLGHALQLGVYFDLCCIWISCKQMGFITALCYGNIWRLQQRSELLLLGSEMKGWPRRKCNLNKQDKQKKEIAREVQGTLGREQVLTKSLARWYLSCCHLDEESERQQSEPCHARVGA